MVYTHSRISAFKTKKTKPTKVRNTVTCYIVWIGLDDMGLNEIRAHTHLLPPL